MYCKSCFPWYKNVVIEKATSLWQKQQSVFFWRFLQNRNMYCYSSNCRHYFLSQETNDVKQLYFLVLSFFTTTISLFKQKIISVCINCENAFQSYTDAISLIDVHFSWFKYFQRSINLYKIIKSLHPGSNKAYFGLPSSSSS